MGWLKRHRPALSMVAVQVFIAGMLLLSKVILDRGMFVFAFLTYRHVVAAIFVSPFALFLERKQRPKMTLLAMWWIFLCAAFGYVRKLTLPFCDMCNARITMGIGFYYYGIFYTSATFAANFLNMIPIVTFVLVVVLRIEKAGLRTISGRMKIAGTIICVGGATIITLCKGSSLKFLPSLWHDAHKTDKAHRLDWTRGSVMLIASSVSDALWFVSQVKLLETYPAKYSATALTCWVGSLQSVIIGFAVNRDLSAWKLGMDLQLITVIYSGVLTSGAAFCLITWCISKRGPTYVTMFSPLVLILVGISEILFLGGRLYVGSALGSILIVGGLYAFLWGKSKETGSQAIPVMEKEEVPVATQEQAEREATTARSTMIGAAIDEACEVKNTIISLQQTER